MRQPANVFKKHLAKRSVVVASAVVASVGSVGGIAFALTSGSSAPLSTASTAANTSTTAPAASSTPKAAARPGKAAARIRSIVGHAVRVQIVVPKAGGGFRTVDLDRGSVTALSSTSITVAPLDGGGPVTAAITGTTHEPKSATITQGENVVLLSSDGNAISIRPMRSASAANGTAGPGSSSTSTTS